MAEEVIYLWFKINKNSVTPINENIENIKATIELRNVSELKSFSALICYYPPLFQKLLVNFRALHAGLRKGVKWEWGKKQKTVFEKVKFLIHENDILVHYNLNKPLQLACGASTYGLGVVLSHIMTDGIEKPVSYASETQRQREIIHK